MKITESPIFKTESSRNVRYALRVASQKPTPEEAAITLRTMLPRYFVYRGGSHVALHRSSGAERIGLIVEDVS